MRYSHSKYCPCGQRIELYEQFKEKLYSYAAVIEDKVVTECPCGADLSQPNYHTGLLTETELYQIADWC